MKDAEGKPLRSDLVTFGGWRHGPWYALDGTHPEAQKHLEMDGPRIGRIRRIFADLICENPSDPPNPWSIHLATQI